MDKHILMDSIGLSEGAAQTHNTDMELLGRCNPYKSFEGEGFGVCLARDAEFNNLNQKVFVANDRQQAKMALDSAEFSIPSNGVPSYLTTIWNQKPIKQILKTTPLRALTKDWQQGEFGTTDIKIPTVSFAGQDEIYTDLGGDGDSSVNYNWVPRQTITLQRTLKYGDMTQAQMALAKIEYVANLREGVASLINININNIGFLGYAGVQVYGLLNDPSLNATIAAPNGVSGSALWSKKTYNELYADVQSMFASIQAGGNGNIEVTAKCTLGVAPAVYTYLVNTINALGTNTLFEMLQKAFPQMTIVQVPNYQGTGDPIGSTLPNKAQLIFDEVNGQPVAYNIFSNLYNSHGVVRLLSSFAEKVSYTVSGAFIALPFAVATISGI